MFHLNLNSTFKNFSNIKIRIGYKKEKLLLGQKKNKNKYENKFDILEAMIKI